MRRLASRANPRIKEWAALAQKSARDELCLTLADGIRLSAEGLEADPALYRPRALLVSDAGAERPEAGALFARAGERGVERWSLADDCYARVSGLKNGDGVALVLEYAPEAAAQPGQGRWLAAAGVQDPGNAGALARIALAVGAAGCVYVDGADPRSPKFLRGAMGASFRLPCVAMTAEAFTAAWAGSGSRLLAACAGAGRDYRDIDYGERFTVLVGGERGIPEALRTLADEAVRIPLRGGVESLNLAVAAGVIMFEATRSDR